MRHIGSGQYQHQWKAARKNGSKQKIHVKWAVNLQIQHTLSVVFIPRTSSYFTLAAVLLPDRDLIGLTGPVRPISGPHETLARFFIYVSHTLTFCVCYKHICVDLFANAFEFT
jgi:hypothetical protein